MKKFFEAMGLKKFRQNSTFFFLLADVWTLGYIYKKFTNKEVMGKLIEIAARQQGLEPNHMKQLYQIMTQSLILMLVLVALVHVINYVLYNKNKQMAFAYLNFYAWSGSVGCALWGVSLLKTQFVPALVFIAVAGLFLYNALGLRVYPHKLTKKN